MIDLAKLFLAPVLASAIVLTGCGGDASHDHDGHDHMDHRDGNSHDHNHKGADTAEHTLGEVDINGTVLVVSLDHEPTANAAMHIHLTHQGGPTLAAIRIWIGDAAATGIAKSKASGSGSTYHADVTCPARLTQDTLLWIEAESTDGSRSAKSLALR